MKTFACKKCGSADLFTKDNGTQLGLYCSDCGAWQKWIGKDEKRLVDEWIKSVTETNSKVETTSNNINTELYEVIKALKYAHRFASRDDCYDFQYVADIIDKYKL